MSDLAARLADIRARITRAAIAAGRDPGSVTLLAVSKTHPPALVQEALAAGQLLFGENRAQELRDKADAVGPQARWHFIGPLQRNKVKYVVGRVLMLETLDSLELATEVSDRILKLGSPPLPVLVEVHLGGEASKHGVEPDDTLPLCHQVHALPGVELRGLMTVPPYDDDPQKSALWFDKLRALAVQGQAEGLPLFELSMGMSHDFEVAIAHGATIVRVGTALFGER